MRIAIFSDIHGNLQALESVLADIEAQKPDAIYCLGDLVGYGANPNEVTERVRREGYPTVIRDEAMPASSHWRRARSDNICATRDPRPRTRCCASGGSSPIANA